MDYFVLGKSLPHTLSPKVHGLLGISGYDKVEVGEQGLAELLRAKNFLGCNVTVPYKKAVMEHLDWISPTARGVGAVNTIVNKNGVLHGYNTDIGGFSFALTSNGICVEGKTVLILGTGATSNTAEYALKKMGTKKVVKVGRTSAVNYSNVYAQVPDAEVVINTTPVGTFPNAFETPIDVAKFGNLSAVFDVVYNPLNTELCNCARTINAKCAGGIDMLVEQARLAEELFLNAKIEQSKTKEVKIKLLKEFYNIVLIGMPSSGKSSVAQAVAKLLKRPLIDLDAEICKKEGMDVPFVFATKGEEYFRQVEAELCLDKSLELGVVLATGGGTVMNERSFNALRKNGVVFYLERPTELLQTGGRPLSEKVGNDKIFAVRESVYKQADFTVKNYNKTIDEVAKEIVDIYEKSFSDKRC